MEKWRIYFPDAKLPQNLVFRSYLGSNCHEYIATKGILRPNPNAFELTLMIGGA